MAEEVPVSEVLFNATEYLCKLGSNLRSRSQNLKDKRISKDKLKNTHAVRKAATKLLLMCELSKKSLENVENGVKRVLKIVDASRCSPRVGAKIKTVSERGDTKKEYFHFEHDSFKLKISKKILLKHYTSVKVHAKSMPASMLDKYPVFYKCNLYRKRRKAMREGDKDCQDLCKEKESKITVDKGKTTKKNKDEDPGNCISNTQESACLESEMSKKESDNEANSVERNASCKSPKKKKNEDEEIQENVEETGPNNKNENTDDSTLKKSNYDSEKKSKSKNECNETLGKIDNEEKSKECVHETLEKYDSIEDGQKSASQLDTPISVNTNLEETEAQTKSGSSKRAPSLDSNKTCTTISKPEDRKEKNKSEKPIKSNKSKSVRFLDDSSESSVTVKGNERKKKKPNIENQSIEISSKEPEVVSLLDDESPKKSDRSDLEKEKIEKNEEESEKKTSQRPMIKLVSLNKLLKPDLLKNEIIKPDMTKNPIRKTYGNNKRKMDMEKKKKVLAFKPKKFDVVVSRMPTFSDEYLCKNNIKRITQNGTIIYNLSSEKLNVKDSSVNELCPKTNVAVNRRLKKTVNIDLTDDANDSQELIDENKKQSDVAETDVLTKIIDSVNSEKESSRDEPCVQGNQSPNSNNKSDDKIANKEKENNCDLDEKNSLESVDPPKTPEGKVKNTDETTPRSKRKLIMESMHAKKMLLTYSSSSDTDDDQLRNALTDIKNALLNVSSSDEEINLKKTVQSNHRQLTTPSDSDDSLKIYKKQHKTKKDPFAEKEQDEASSISQVDGTHDEQSNSSSSQMGRSKTSAASSSNQNNETVDSNDIEITRLSNLNTLTRSRRRRGSSEKVATRGRQRIPKALPIQEEMLEPESSGSLSEIASDAADIEELPSIAAQELNGDGINHLAKEDLLAQSDSSCSQNDANDKGEGSEDKKEDSEDDEDGNVKSRRRKPNPIDSDSEAGSSRPKADKVSDFEDSESESEPRKKTKRKQKGSDSDASLSSNDGSKKKRRRIKQVNESDGSGSDSETEGKNKHGRKNIRKVMSKNQLEEATKKAARQEKERVARIAERQKLYNNLEFDESGKPDEVVLDKVILDFDPETKEPVIEVDRGLVGKLKPHQANGIKFMWNACFESVKRIKKDRGSGCILAHCMGLGKTLQVVSLTHTLLVHSALTGVKRVLVVCPLSTVLNWVNEFNMWLKHSEADYEVDVFELSRHKQNSERSWQLQQWVQCGGVCVLGYEMFRNLSADNNKKFKKKMLKTFQEALVDPGPDLVVCDEGHLLKNEKTSLSQSMNRVRTLRRIVLTGTPLQNNLKEYYCMVQFVKPNLLGKYNEYLNRFVNPITNGQYTDSTEKDISIMKRRSHVLHTMLDGAVQRRDYGVLAPFLPPKHEFVLFITLTDIQTKLYEHYLEHYSRRPLPGKSSGFLFPDFQSLQRIWTHPLVLKYNSERYEIMQQKKRDKEEEDSEGSLVDFIDDDSTPDESSSEESSDDLSDVSDDSRKKKKKKSTKKGKSNVSGRRGTRANPVEQLEEERPNPEADEMKLENPTEWWMKLVTDDELEDIRHSHKLLLLFDILRQCETIGDKLLVFSQSLYSLDLIEHFLGKVDEATQEGRIDEKLAGHVGSWSPGVDYFRLDGSTSCENRSIWCKNFNREDNPRARLFLISTRAGGLGINLVAANRVVIFDVSWNPSHDVQSIFRVYRFGQKKPCYIYRFLAMGTMEEKIYERQVTKQAISKRVIDEQQIDRHYAANDLAELYRFEPRPAEPRPVPSLPKDRLFAEMLKEHDAAIYRFHEHDSLLENKEEETLSEEERKRAWEEFENEKKAPPPSPFPNNWAFNNGMAASLLQQQQQLAYVALAAMIRKDMPNINDAQIRDMLPIICNANPGMFGGYDYGLMQKMNEIYKYAQPGMMNPSMMNPVMNHGGGGVSASSSLQYEPPWQRQQQQQQQMRLQQLMQQQQQSMGAKYYAGGLGSRDPVAMALQQQRAREFLLGGGGGGGVGGGGAGGGAGRPRGRPPLQPRAPPADVVNLADSD